MSVHHGRLVVSKGDFKIRELRVDEVERLVLMGNVSLSAAAARILLVRAVDTTYLTRGGRFLGRLSNGLGKNVARRCEQHRRLGDSAFALDLARRMVTAKVMNQRRLLQRYQRRRPDELVAKALVLLRSVVERLPGVDSLESLRGWEGRAARVYFEGFARLVNAPGIVFCGRKRRPPPDPPNVLLSFGYTMLLNWMTSYCELAGLDPYVGALHTVDYGRPSLSLDLIEELRPLVVDTTVLAMLNRRAITWGDFVVADEEEAEVEVAWESAEADGEVTDGAIERPIVFRREGVAKWVTAMERRLDEGVFYPKRGEQLSYRHVMREQVNLLARHIAGEDEYEGFEGPM